METFKVTGGIQEELNIEWTIENFLDDYSNLYASPNFSFAGHVWGLKLYPRGRKPRNCGDYMSIYLRRNSFGPDVKINYSLGLKTQNGEIDPELHCTDTFGKSGMSFGLPKFLLLAEFLDKNFDLLTSNTLVVVCSLKNMKSTEDKTNEKLLNDLKGLMLSEDYSDVTIKVKGEEFKLHKNILGARNIFFNAMFKTEMREKVTGIVCIDDCEPHVFRSFIHFLYTGKVDDLSSKNVCDLYEVADKYQEDQLKEECLNFMISSISVGNFCDYAALAIRQDEKKLLKITLEFFGMKTMKIVQRPQWQIFLREYPTFLKNNPMLELVNALDNLDDD